MEKGELIGQGRTAEVYRWGEDRVLKLYNSHMPPRAVEGEFALTRLAQAAGVPVPYTEAMVEVNGRLGIIFERRSGPSMLRQMSDRPWMMIACARMLGDLHAQIHRSRAFTEASSQREQIEHGIQAARALAGEMKSAALAALTGLPQGESLCHGDFHPDNILMTARGPVIIDWMTATRGNPLGDICRSCLIMQTGGLPPGIPFVVRVMINLSRRLIVSTYRRRYLELHPASPQEIDAWQLPLMAARLREVEQYPQETEIILTRIQGIIQARQPEDRKIGQ